MGIRRRVAILNFHLSPALVNLFAPGLQGRGYGHLHELSGVGFRLARHSAGSGCGLLVISLQILAVIELARNQAVVSQAGCGVWFRKFPNCSGGGYFGVCSLAGPKRGLSKGGVAWSSVSLSQHFLIVDWINGFLDGEFEQFPSCIHTEGRFDDA